MASEEKTVDVMVKVSGEGPEPGKSELQFEVQTHFDSPVESLSMTVRVPDEGSESANKTAAIARAKKLARLFAENG